MTYVNIQPLKEKAMAFPEPVKSLILSEPDQMDSNEFVLKLSTWDRLAKLSTNQQEAVKK